MRKVASENDDEVCDSLIAVVLHDPDGEWAEESCLELVAHPSAQVRGLVATCFGHLARIHGKLNLKKVSSVLSELSADDAVAGRVQDALDDIEVYLGVRPSL